MTGPANITTSTTAVAANKLLTPQTGTLVVSPRSTGGQGLSLTPNGLIPSSVATYLPYTSTWTSAGVQPVLGNGTISGRYVHIGKLVSGKIVLQLGSTSTAGTGEYRLSLPITGGDATVVGSGYLYQNSTNSLWTTTVYMRSTSTVTFFITGASGAYQVGGASAPFAWATNDQIFAHFTYEAAL